MQIQIPPWVSVVAVLTILAWLGLRPAVDVYVDWLWFDSLGYLDVFQTSLYSQAGLFVGGFVLAALFAGINLWIAIRKAPVNLHRIAIVGDEVRFQPGRIQTLLRLGAVGAVSLVSLIFAQNGSRAWLDLLAWRHQIPFGMVDPVFGNDVGFYVFTLPLLWFGQVNMVGLIAITMLITAGWHLLHAATHDPQRPRLGDAGRAQLMVLMALLLVCISGGWWLERFELLMQRHGAVQGIGYTDEHARLPGFAFMAVVSIGCAVALLASVRKRGWQPLLVVLGVYLGSRVLVSELMPRAVQDYIVKPNELDLEREYLERDITFTRKAFALDRIEVRPFAAEAKLTMEDIQANPLTVDNIRIWDTRPLLTTYRQLQEIRTYYDFQDVDVDRYMIDGVPRQVMLAAREMNAANLRQAESWVNVHLQYTHGYGFTMSPVNVVTEEGLPDLFVKDIPPEVRIDLDVTRPEIYYGELSSQYVLTGTGEKEFDYPMGDQNVYSEYEGDGGVELGGLLRQSALAMHFQTLDILLSQYIDSKSKVLFRRNIEERVSRVAPFLEFDSDPYLVVADGRLVWMIDAYTLSGNYPYASALTSAASRRRVNYVRNSVKVTVDAYEGAVRFYVADAEDPLIQVYSDIFPGAFKPLSDMPESIQAHIRYPADFFSWQALKYRTYHMQDATVFYNSEDLWDTPKAQYAGDDQPMRPYYLIMKLPGEEKAEFILLVPYVPTGKDNMIAWMAARSDGEAYGKLVMYQFPKQKLIYGPRQIEARIDQTPEISEQLTLWSQAGSSVLRGNLLVIPIEDSLMYVEPVYLQANKGQLPELKRVIVAYENRIAMERTLEEALASVFDVPSPTSAAAVPDDGTGPSAAPDRGSWRDLVMSASDAWQAADMSRREGDWEAFGKALARVGGELAQLQVLAGGEGEGLVLPAPEPAPEDAPVEQE